MSTVTSTASASLTPPSRQGGGPVAPLVEALRELRVAFVKRGVPVTVAATNEEAAWQAAFWAVYEVGHVLDEIQHRTDRGERCRSVVSAIERGPGRITLELSVLPAIETPSSAPRAQGGLP